MPGPTGDGVDGSFARVLVLSLVIDALEQTIEARQSSNYLVDEAIGTWMSGANVSLALAINASLSVMAMQAETLATGYNISMEEYMKRLRQAAASVE